MIERKERCLRAFQLGSHIYIVEVAGKVCENTLIKSECRFIRVAVILPLTHSVIHRLSGELILQFNRHNGDAVDSQHHIDCICVAFRIVPLADTLADILLVVGDGHLVQRRLWLKIAHPKIDATMLKAVTQDRNQTILRDGIFKCLIKLPNRVDRTHPLEAFPCHRLGTFYEIGQSDDVQKHIFAFIATITGIRCLCPSAFFGNKIILYEFLKAFFCFVHGHTTFLFPDITS